jgi:hypothetical protein
MNKNKFVHSVGNWYKVQTGYELSIYVLSSYIPHAGELKVFSTRETKYYVQRTVTVCCFRLIIVRVENQ